MFEPFGELEFVDLHRDPMTGRSKGYAFVQLVSYYNLCSAQLSNSMSDIRGPRMREWLSSKWRVLNWLVVLYDCFCLSFFSFQTLKFLDSYA